MENKALARKRYEDASALQVRRRAEDVGKFEDMGQADAYIEMLGASELKPAMRRFLGAFAILGIVTEACKAAGISQRSVYTYRQDAEFEDMYHEAYKIANDRLENEALRLATGHYERPVVSMGKVVTYERIYDTKLLATLLRARNPEKFATKIDVTSNGQSLVKLVDKDAWDSV